MSSSRKQIVVIAVVALVALALVVLTLRSFATGGDDADRRGPAAPMHDRRTIKGRDLHHSRAGRHD